MKRTRGEPIKRTREKPISEATLPKKLSTLRHTGADWSEIIIRSTEIPKPDDPDYEMLRQDRRKLKPATSEECAEANRIIINTVRQIFAEQEARNDKSVIVGR